MGYGGAGVVERPGLPSVPGPRGQLSDEAEMNGWAGDLTKAQLPDQFLVDYVRVYDLVDRK